MPKVLSVWLAIALVLVAFILRVIDVDRRPLHFDEGINVTFGQKTPVDILALSRATFDNDPPGHRMALGLWMALTGPSSVSIRLFSVGFSLLMVAGLYRLLRRMRQAQVTALMAAALVAISPYAIDYAQQAKGYAMGAGLAAISWLMWITLISPEQVKRPRARMRSTGVFITYVVTTALALSTHYYVLLLLPMQWLWFAAHICAGEHLCMISDVFRLRWWRESLPQIVRGAAGQALAMVPMGIWLALMAAALQVSTARSSTRFDPASPFELIAGILAEMSAGQFVEALPQRVCGVIMLVLAVIGAMRLWRSPGADGRRPAFWFGAAVLVPLAGAVVLQQRVTFFFPRFLVYALPGLAVLAAGCMMPYATRSVTPILRVAPVVAAVGVMVFGAATFYTAPIDSENDFRPLIAQMRPYIKPGDAALGTYIWMEGMFDSYAPESNGTVTWYPESYSPDTVGALLAPIANNHPRIWSLNFLRDPDAPDTLSNVWLKQNAAYVQRFSAGVTTAVLFDMRRSVPPTSTAAPSSTVTFGDLIALQYTPLDAESSGGDSVSIVLTWTALQPVKDHYLIFLHLMSPNGELLAQNDGDAVNGMAPSFTWTLGQPVSERRAIAIPPVSTGQYTLEAGLFREGDGQRLLTANGVDEVSLGTITVTQ